MATLNTTQTTRPGWLRVSREKKFDQAIDPAYALVTLILTCARTTSAPVKASATPGGNTEPNAVAYIRPGSTACSGDTPCDSASQASSDPANSFSIPGPIQPGPAARTATHQRQLSPGFGLARNRRKSTCSPTCAISDMMTEAAAPNGSRANAGTPAASKCVQPAQSTRPKAMRANGARFSTIQAGCVQRWNRPITRMPLITMGMTMRAAAM